VPSLLIQALDDPWIPNEPYRRYAWRSNPSLTPLLADSGGHVGFVGVDRRTPWHDLAMARFLDAVVSRP
jgi:predicted alpha/beta-fold hydrolase